MQKLLKQNVKQYREQHVANDEYKVYYFDQVIDHFQFNTNNTFSQKYLIRDKYYKEGGPILFYCGNEGPIEMFYENSGFLNDDLAEKFNALVVYMEHRYYGDSWPFGNEKDSYKKENLVYLTSIQALYDYSIFLDQYKKDNNMNDVPIIAFGGSYGGMLASWMRMKFPNTIQGALGASAPIVYFMNRKGLDLSSFYQIATGNYNHKECNDTIKEGFDRLEKMYFNADESEIELLNNVFNLCTPMTKKEQIFNLGEWVTNGYSYMAMTNYPYETSFLKPLPAWPANYSCNAMEDVNKNSNNIELFTAIKNSVETFYNYDGSESCNEIFDQDAQSDDDMSGWLIQACAELVMPMDSTGQNNMFPYFKWDSELYDAQCEKEWGLKTDYDWALNFYGGRNDNEFQGYSNIFLSNGMLDPWAGGGVYYQNKENDFNYILMPECAHHLDLRSPNKNDPVYVQEGRQQEIEAIQRWINSYQKPLSNKSSVKQNTKQQELVE